VATTIEAITFDLWDTMICDETDEPKRKAQGLAPKPVARRELLHAALARHGDIDFATVATAYDVADAAFNKVWKGHSVTWTVAERLGVLLDGLGRSLPADEMAQVVETTENMEGDVPPDAVEGIRQALEILAGRYKLCVVSDALVSPGRVLRGMLRRHGLEDYFQGFVFSDEIECSKPDPRIFYSAAEQLGVDLTAMVHIGDRDHNDVKGPQALGMKAVLFTAVRAHDEKTTSADAICRHHDDLPGIIDGLAAG
jgi:putative hydrolase of the HAD superfamily